MSANECSTNNANSCGCNEKTKSYKLPLDVTKIRELLPHRYPFLLIDRVLEIEDAQRIVAIKNVTINEPFFNGHFPERPVMPGVLILEAMAQAGGILARLSTDGLSEDKYVYLVGATDVKWRKQVLPGDTLRIELKVVKRRRPMWVLKGEVTVEGQLVAEGTVSAAEV